MYTDLNVHEKINVRFNLASSFYYRGINRYTRPVRWDDHPESINWKYWRWNLIHNYHNSWETIAWRKGKFSSYRPYKKEQLQLNFV